MDINQDKVIEWLNNHWTGSKHCPVCGHSSWNIQNKAWEIREFQGGSVVIGGPIVPLVVVTCGTCGHTLLFNAIAIGVVERDTGKEVESHE